MSFSFTAVPRRTSPTPRSTCSKLPVGGVATSGRSLLPSNFHVFPAQKQQLSGTCFLCVDDVKTDATRWRRHQQGYEFSVSETDKLVVRSGKCVNRHGDCIKKFCLTSVVTSHKHFFTGTFLFGSVTLYFSDRPTYFTSKL